MDRTVILSAVRTPIGRFGGALHRRDAIFLASEAMRGALAASGFGPEAIPAVILGQAYPAGCGPNPARLAAMAAGLPEGASAFGIQQLCGSGLQAVASGARLLATGEADRVLVGGVESMSQVPYLLPEARWGRRMGGGRALDGLLKDGLECPLTGQRLDGLADQLAHRRAISRADQDAWALRSHHRAAAAQSRARILPLATANRKGPAILAQDEGPRAGIRPAELAALVPSLSPEGTLTPGNSAPFADGAAALVLARQGRGRARIRAFAQVGLAPADLDLGPLPAMKAALRQARMGLGDLDRIELNETSATQVLACLQDLPALDPDRVNTWGGALALGHPMGAAGARLLVTLLDLLDAEGLGTGLVALGIGGGQGVAMIVERLR